MIRRPMSRRSGEGVRSGLRGQPQDDIAVALARAAHGAQAVDVLRIKPNEIVAVGRAILLDAHVRGQCGGDRLVGGGGDGDAEHCP